MAVNQHKKITDSDEGGLVITSYVKNGHVFLDFGKDVSWLSFHKSQLRDLIDKLEEQYKKL